MLFLKGSLLGLLLLGKAAATNPIQGPITGEVTKYENTVPGNPSLTVVHAGVVAPSGSSAVIDFAPSTPEKSPRSSTRLATTSTACPSTSCPVTLIPQKFPPTIATWVEQIDTTFSVPAGSTPVIHFKPIESAQGSASAASVRDNNGPSPAPSSLFTESPKTQGKDQSSAPGVGETSSTTPTSLVSTQPPRGVHGGNSASVNPNHGPSSNSPLPIKSSTTENSQSSSDTEESPVTISSPLVNTPPAANRSTPNGSAQSVGRQTTTRTFQTPNPSNKITPGKPSTTSNSPVQSRTAKDDSQTSNPPQTNNGPRPSKGSHTSDGLRHSKSSHTSDGSQPSKGSHTSNGPHPSKGSQSSNAAQTSNIPDPADSTTSSYTSGSQKSSSSDNTTSRPFPKSSQSPKPDAGTSISLTMGDSPDEAQMNSMLATLKGTSSADVAAMLSHLPTDTATVAWDDLESEMSQIPTSTTTGAAATTEGIALAGWLVKLNSNVQGADLKDKDTWDHVKNNLDEAGGKIDNYIENRKKNDDSGGGSSEGEDSSCTSSGGLFGIFNAVSCFVKKAEDTIKGGSDNIGPIINGGLRLTSSGFTQLKNDLPEPEDIEPEEEEKFKKNFEDLTEAAESLEELEKKEEKQSKTASSSSQSSTPSETATCTSTTTVEDCTSSTLFITSTVSSGGSMSPTVLTSTTSSCSTQTGCDITATTVSTTSYSEVTGACMLRYRKTASSLPVWTGETTTTPDITKASTTDTSQARTSGSGRTPTSTSTSKSAMCSPTIVGSSSSACDCTSTAAKHTLSHRIMKPSDKDCGDINTFPMTSFRQVPSTTRPPATTPSASFNSCYLNGFVGAHTTQTYCLCEGGPDDDLFQKYYSTAAGGGTKCSDLTAFPTSGLINVPERNADPQICSNGGGPDNDKGPGYCKCVQEDGNTSWVGLPITQGTATILEGNCGAISTVSFSTHTIAPPQTVTEFADVDAMVGTSTAFYAEGVVITTDYGVGPLTKTEGIGEPTAVHKAAYESTLPNEDVISVPAKTIEVESGDMTTTFAAEPTVITTHAAEGECKYVQGGAYNIYIIWDIFDWSSDYQDFSDLADSFHSRLKSRSCGVTNFQWKEFVDSYGPAFSFNTAELQDSCVRHAIQDVGGPDTLCNGGDYSGIHWWKDYDSIAGLLAHGGSVDDPHSSYEAQVTGV